MTTEIVYLTDIFKTNIKKIAWIALLSPAQTWEVIASEVINL